MWQRISFAAGTRQAQKDVRVTMPRKTEWISVREAAKELNVSKMTIYRRINDDDLLAVRVGRIIRVRRSSLERYIAENYITGTIVNE